MWAASPCFRIARRSLARGPRADDSLPLPTADPTTDEHLWVWPKGQFQSLPPQKSYLSLTFVHTTSLMQIAAQVSRTIYTGRTEKLSLVESGTVQRFA